MSILADGALDKRDFERVLQPPPQAESLPPWCYTGQDFLDREIARVFHSAWASLGRADRLSSPGDYAALELVGAPLLLLRDKSGALRAFANSCRHRGTKLLEGSGRCRTVTCPFHGWVYALDGTLVHAPDMGGAEGFERGDYGLMPVRLEERDGFIFVNLSDTAPDLDAWLGEFSRFHAPWRLGDMVSARRREFEVACNWKLFLEVFNEYYHLKSVHPNSIGPIYHEPDEPEDLDGEFVTQFGSHDASSGLLEADRAKAFPPITGLEGRNRTGTRYSWVFPNLTFAASSEAIWAYDIMPLEPARTRVGMTCAFPPATMALADFAERSAAYFERLDVAIAEDIAVLELQQAGLTSPLARSGRFSDLEPNVARFERWLAGRCLADA
jgi:phenylpropionate dioxygenase-like ring-hydroxylating dioxygenase large terminal subunit